MKPARMILLAVSVLVLASLACGPLGGTSATDTPASDVPPTFPPTRTPSAASKPTLTPEPVDEALPEAQEATPEGKAESSGATLLITNDADVAVYYLFISQSDSDEWGEDMLGDDVLDPGESYVITDIPPGTYDLKAEDADGNVIEIAWEELLEGEVHLTITGISAIHVVNESSDTIYEVYISPVDSDVWGNDRLGEFTIPLGDGYIFGDLRAGYYDMKVVDPDGNGIETVYNVALYGETEWVVVGSAPLADNAVLRFEEDFTDNRNNWGNVDTEHTNYMAPADGEYCMLVKTENNTAWEWYEPFRTDEFIAEVSCLVEGPQDASCGLGFGPDGDNLYWFEVSAYDQRFALFLLEDGEWQDMLIEWTQSNHINPNAPNFLSLERVDNVVSVFVNGVLIGDAYSNRFPEGRIGLGGSTYEDPGATICLDNLRVWRLERATAAQWLGTSGRGG